MGPWFDRFGLLHYAASTVAAVGAVFLSRIRSKEGASRFTTECKIVLCQKYSSAARLPWVYQQTAFRMNSGVTSK